MTEGPAPVTKPSPTEEAKSPSTAQSIARADRSRGGPRSCGARATATASAMHCGWPSVSCRQKRGPCSTSWLPATTWQRPMLPRNQQVSWWSVHEHVAPLLESAGTWPMVGTPEWCALSDDDPRKLAALYDAARHWALRVETAQQARAEASRSISA